MHGELETEMETEQRSVAKRGKPPKKGQSDEPRTQSFSAHCIVTVWGGDEEDCKKSGGKSLTLMTRAAADNIHYVHTSHHCINARGRLLRN